MHEDPKRVSGPRPISLMLPVYDADTIRARGLSNSITVSTLQSLPTLYYNSSTKEIAPLWLSRLNHLHLNIKVMAIDSDYVYAYNHLSILYKCL
ncbi:hypothetical protein LENED_004970 [Lentinula edodes]|uniref:Uncharacterized protein n=1 Tax=Lentinula edodes TaxID=5353 RepID=A0A1Q3E7W1_LENED|nr:hypothetical protein LENED_004970 [Lentinula edodes]